MKPSLRNRIRSYTRWPSDRAERVSLAKTDIAAAMFCARIRLILPEDLRLRADRAADRLEQDQVPIGKWEE